MKTVCLVMIVKNESAVIRRCLEGVKNILGHWVICDTGSNDGTQQIVRDVLSGIPGELHETPWISFGHNRTVAMQLAAGKADYHLLIDADMTVSIYGEFRDKLTLDSYLIRHEGDCDYWIDRLVSDRHPWRYVGATHEFIYADTAKTRGKLIELSVTHHEDGGSRIGKYQRDIQLLRHEVGKDAANARAVFYLAQSYRDAGNLQQAIEWYEKRASMGGWPEEVWFSLYQVARLQHRLGIAWPLVMQAYLNAYEYRPTRLEPLFYLTREFRENGLYNLGYLFSRAIVGARYPDDILFIERNIYERDLKQEYETCSRNIGL
jgi:glycosyltransferase involved in cell wall biosynthesis